MDSCHLLPGFAIVAALLAVVLFAHIPYLKLEYGCLAYVNSFPSWGANFNTTCHVAKYNT